MSGAGTACFHCGEPIPAGFAVTARIGDRDQPVCCYGCKAVAEFITGSGLGDYYRYRDANSTRADESPRPDRWTAYDKPELVERLTRAEPGGARSMTVLLEGLRCAACSWLADKALRLQSGVLDVSVNPATARARLVWNPDKVRLGDLLRVLESVGLRPHPISGEPAVQLALLERRTALKRLAVAGLGMMQVMMFSVPLYIGESSGMDSDIRQYLRLISMLVCLPVVLYAGWPFYAGAWQALRARGLNMDVPVSLGIVLAFVASVFNALRGEGDIYFDSVTMFIFFLSVGRYVEMIARHRAGSVADALARLAPVTARRIRGNSIEDVQVIDLSVGDTLLVRSGEVLAADGLVLAGDGRVDESMLTGESAAIAKGPGSRVNAGTHNLGAPLEVRVEAVAGDTVLSGIFALLERAHAERPRIARSADRAAAWFLSRILIGAALVCVAWMFVDPSRALPATLAVLVATCPCALSLATPAALAAATSALARRGVLVAHTDAFEALAASREVLWDKTGTLTQGLVKIEEIQPLAKLPANRCLELAAALERWSEHPIARAFLAVSDETETATDVEVHGGEGLEGLVAGRRYRLGDERFVLQLERHPRDSERLAAPEKSGWIYLGDSEGPIAAFRLTDQLRAEARDCVSALEGLGITSRIVSGDQVEAVARIASRCGVEIFESRMTPLAKLEYLKDLQSDGRIVAAVGDGINDAPLLRGADVAVAMGRGSALAQTSADFILVRDSLDEVPATVVLARRTKRVIRQNLAWAFGYNLLVLPLAALGFVPPWLAAIGMSLSSVAVVLNSTRLSRKSPTVDGGRWTAVEQAKAAG
jgi:P-type Cu2+ transporter